MYLVSCGRRIAWLSRWSGLAGIAVLALVTAGCVAGGTRGASSGGQRPVDTIAADLEPMIEGFPLQLMIGVRAVENARTVRHEAESRRLAALGRRERDPEGRLRAGEREAAEALAEAVDLLESMDTRMTLIEAHLAAIRRLKVRVDQTADKAGRGRLSRRDRNRLQRLYAQAQTDYNAITGAVVRLKGRWLLPDFDGEASGLEKP